jgi:NADH:ubiquinone oxidoreductase subunit C
MVKALTNGISPLVSLSSLYNSSNWLEREVWDLFGIFFSDHPDLRRILTDYGFQGFPMRKDFPLSGFVEIAYSDEFKKVIYLPLELTQEYRFFDFSTSWQ